MVGEHNIQNMIHFQYYGEGLPETILHHLKDCNSFG